MLGALPSPVVRNVDKLSRDELAESMSEQVTSGLGEASRALDSAKVRKLVIKEHVRLQAALSSEEWVKLLPGKMIFTRFCGDFFSVEPARVREAYTDIAMRVKPQVFEDVDKILRGFANVATTANTA